MRKCFALLLFLVGCQKIETSIHSGAVGLDLASAPVKPNIILIVGDDIGYELPSCNGGQSYQTPNLDFMARRGIRYTNCFGSPDCAPSRSMILTGKYCFRNYTKWGHMDTTNRTLGNMLKDAGYSTCYAGKWQLDGYEPAVHAFGFEKYSIWDPGLLGDAGSRYKSPHIYQDGGFLPDNVTLNKYGDDWFTDYIFHFIGTASKPYFVYYAIALCHPPFQPTPDDAAFATWDINNEDPIYFPSMVKYMDKKIGQILDSVDRNTVVIYVGDNGTPSSITSLWNGMSIVGGKGETTVWGTHVPLLQYRRGYPAKVDSSLVDFTDFMPTLASIANIPVPTTYGILDGISFYPQSVRPWIFCHFEPHPNGPPGDLARWVQNSVYKRYDAEDTLGARKNKFFNFVLDPYELKPIPRKKETPEEHYLDSTFGTVLRTMHN